jgi:tryptophan synthase alpha subunit
MALIGFIFHEYMQVLLRTLTTPKERIEKIAQAPKGFLSQVLFT